MNVIYTGHYVTEQSVIMICFTLSIGGGAKRFLQVAVPAHGLDNEQVHDAMATAAMELMRHHSAPPWEEDSLPLWR